MVHDVSKMVFSVVYKIAFQCYRSVILEEVWSTVNNYEQMWRVILFWFVRTSLYVCTRFRWHFPFVALGLGIWYVLFHNFKNKKYKCDPCRRMYTCNVVYDHINICHWEGFFLFFFSFFYHYFQHARYERPYEFQVFCWFTSVSVECCHVRWFVALENKGKSRTAFVQFA